MMWIERGLKNDNSMAIKVKKVKKKFTPRQEANKLARELGGKLLNATGYDFIQEGWPTERYKSLGEFMFVKGENSDTN